MINLKYLRNIPEYVSSYSGNRTKIIRKLINRPEENIYKLIDIKEVDLQEQINSYYDSTNYKQIIEKLHGEDITEAITRYFPDGMKAVYGDITDYHDNLLDNISLAREVQIYNDFMMKQKKMIKKEEKIITEEKKVNE